ERRIATPAAPSSRSADSNQVNNEAALQHRLFRQQKSPRHNAVDLEQQHVKLEKQTMVVALGRSHGDTRAKTKGIDWFFRR
uniref:Uncharacterized protein n=1 Tax=Triticum urartu TaxID=4572 RepID=A0A8R7QKV1_TRIUA